MRLRLIAVACLLVITAAGCGGGDDQRAVETRAPETATPTACSIRDGSMEAQRSDTTPEAAPVTDVRYSTEDCPDRIVFEFTDHVSGYVVEYASPPFSECGSGEEVSTDGWNAGAFLTVRLEPSGSADLSDPEARQTYDGPRDIDVAGSVLKHLKVICDFEAVFEWLVGLDARHDFSVVVLEDPPRLVIDISET